MKSTPNVNGNGTNGADNKNANGQHGPKLTIKPGEVVSVADLIKKAKEENPDDIKEPTTYPAAVAPEHPEPEATATDEPAAPAPEAPAPAPQAVTPTAPPVPTRSRADEITYQIEKSAKLQLINQQLQNLKGKYSELKQFRFNVSQDDDHRYGRLMIYDDANREFQCKHHGLTALVVEGLLTMFADKIEEKENELLTVSQS